MPTKRQYDTNAARQAAYRTRKALSASPARPYPPTRPGLRRWDVLLTQARLLLTDVTDEMAAYEAARSEAWHDSERGELFAERCEIIQEALSLLGDLPEA